MMVRLKAEEHVDVLFKKRLKLKDVGFPSKYFTKDLAPEEREEQKKSSGQQKVLHHLLREGHPQGVDVCLSLVS